MDIRSYQSADQDQVIALWEACDLLRPWNDPIKDIQRKLERDPELFLVGTINQNIVASAMVGYEGHRGWINYLAVNPVYQRHGYGRQMMQHAEQLLKQLDCPKVNLQIRTDNSQAIEFYRALGYQTDQVVGLGKRLQVDG
jgi:ribosomal protein S18 acetylase RimI-like enzyme